MCCLYLCIRVFACIFGWSVVCWFVGLLVCWFVGLLVCWFAVHSAASHCTCTCRSMSGPVETPMPSYTHVHVPVPMYPCTHAPIHTPTYPCTHTYTHAPMHTRCPLTHEGVGWTCFGCALAGVVQPYTREVCVRMHACICVSTLLCKHPQQPKSQQHNSKTNPKNTHTGQTPMQQTNALTHALTHAST